MSEEVGVMDADLGTELHEGTDIGGLSLGLRRIVWCSGDFGSEVLDGQNVVVRLEDRFKQQAQIQPFPGRFPQRAVIQVEAVDVDECVRSAPSKKQGPPKRPCALRSKPQGELPQIYPSGPKISSNFSRR